MKLPTFTRWLEHCGETRLAEIIVSSEKCYSSMWEDRTNPSALRQFPAWELTLGFYWQENEEEWHSRWRECGGRLFEGRMIAAKWDAVWERLSSTFYDGLGHPYPPYARSSCARWASIDEDEAIVVGAISESEFLAHTSQAHREPLNDEEGNIISREELEELRGEIAEEIYRCGGPPRGATRAERVAHEHQRRLESLAQAKRAYENRNRESNERDSAFWLLEQVEASLRGLPSVKDARRPEWLLTSLKTLTLTPYFERYPYRRVRAWLLLADLHRQSSDPISELSCLENALRLRNK
jgi:hypothetical protein